MGVLLYYIFQNYRYYTMFEGLYEAEQYEILSQINTIVKKSPENYHNLWNVSYRMFEREYDTTFLEDAVSYYSGSLSLKDNEDTQFNYDFTKALLDLLQAWEEENQQQEEEQDSEEEQSQEWWDWEQDTSGTGSWENQNGDETIPDNRTEQYYLEEWQEVPELSESERQQIQEYTENLKREQEHNQQFFNKQESQSEFWNIFDNFFWDVNRWGERDW